MISRFPTGRIRRIGHRSRFYVAFKVLAIKLTSKNKHIKLIIVRCVLEQTVRQNMHLLYKYRCLQNIAIYTQNYDQFDEYYFHLHGLHRDLWGKKNDKKFKMKIIIFTENRISYPSLSNRTHKAAWPTEHI